MYEDLFNNYPPPIFRPFFQFSSFIKIHQMPLCNFFSVFLLASYLLQTWTVHTEMALFSWYNALSFPEFFHLYYFLWWVKQVGVWLRARMRMRRVRRHGAVGSQKRRLCSRAVGRDFLEAEGLNFTCKGQAECAGQPTLDRGTHRDL